MNDEKLCTSCQYYNSRFGLCTNFLSPYCVDTVSWDNGCEKWTEREGDCDNETEEAN